MGGLFTRIEFLSFETLSRDHRSTTRGPVLYRIRFMKCRSFLANKKLFHKEGEGGWTLSGIFHYFFFETFPKGLPPAKNNLHVMKLVLHDTGPKVVPRWLRERVSKLRNSVLVHRPPNLP